MILDICKPTSLVTRRVCEQCMCRILLLFINPLYEKHCMQDLCLSNVTCQISCTLAFIFTVYKHQRHHQNSISSTIHSLCYEFMNLKISHSWLHYPLKAFLIIWFCCSFSCMHLTSIFMQCVLIE